MKQKSILIALFLACLFACGEDDLQIEEVSGTIVDSSGMVGLEDCGFLIRIDGNLYKPNHLNRQYEENGLQVLMKVEFLNQQSDCSTLPLAPLRIRIEQIRPAD